MLICVSCLNAYLQYNHTTTISLYIFSGPLPNTTFKINLATI